MALKPEMPIDESQCGDLLFSSVAPAFRTDLLLSRNVTSRTYSFYYPKARPDLKSCAIVASTNANYADWAGLSREDYNNGKRHLVENTLAALEKYVPNVRSRLDYVEAATPLTFERSRGIFKGPASARSSRVWPSAGPCPNRSPDCIMPAAWASSCPAGWGRSTTA